MRKRWLKSLAACLACIAFAGGCIGLDLTVRQRGKPASGQAQPMEKDKYNGAGLLQGQALSEKVLYESSELICYEDRALHKYTYKTKYPQTVGKQTKNLLVACPELEKVYVLPVPPRICTEPGQEESKAAYGKFCEGLQEELPQNAIFVDALPRLAEHSGEYVFFRTEDSWTARGAYYGMQALGEAMEMQVISLEAYEESMYNSFTGGVKYLDDVWASKDISFPVDWTYYYLIPGSVNRAEILRLDENGQMFSFKKPLITISARNDGTFIDAAYVRAIVDGETQEKSNRGKYLLVICDEKGKLIVPYLKDYYDGVYVINVKEDGAFARDVHEILRAYHITEAVYVQNACDMGVDGYDKAWQGFAR